MLGKTSRPLNKRPQNQEVLSEIQIRTFKTIHHLVSFYSIEQLSCIEHNQLQRRDGDIDHWGILDTLETAAWRLHKNLDIHPFL